MKNSISNDEKSLKDAHGNSMYHFTATPVRVCWKRHKQIESFMREFEEHHGWKVITWFTGSSPTFPSNLVMSKSSLARIIGQAGWCDIESLVSLDKSGRFQVARNGNEAIELDLLVFVPCDPPWI